VDWERYKSLCDHPRYWSRWMLEQSLQLCQGLPQALALARALQRPPLPKPAGHRGHPHTDMLPLLLPEATARCVFERIREAARLGESTPATAQRGLGGFVEAWSEYVDFLSRRDARGWHAQREDLMMSDESCVRELIDAFNANDIDRVVACFAEDAVYHNMPTEPVTGTAMIRATLQGFLGAASQVDWELLHIVADGSGAVLTERVDRFEINGTWISLPVMGTFEVRDEQIVAWRDYFDMAQFQTQFAAATQA
jgi:limonene-1,2-epoxide hydrolase